MLNEEMGDGQSSSSMFELPEDVQDIRLFAQEMAEEIIISGAAERDQSHEYPAEIIGQLAENGFMGMFVPEKYGGAGLDMVAFSTAIIELGRADASVAITMAAHNSLGTLPLLTFGSKKQKDKYLPDLASGKTVRRRRQRRVSSGLDRFSYGKRPQIGTSGGNDPYDAHGANPQGRTSGRWFSLLGDQGQDPGASAPDRHQAVYGSGGRQTLRPGDGTETDPDAVPAQAAVSGLAISEGAGRAGGPEGWWCGTRHAGRHAAGSYGTLPALIR